MTPSTAEMPPDPGRDAGAGTMVGSEAPSPLSAGPSCTQRGFVLASSTSSSSSAPRRMQLGSNGEINDGKEPVYLARKTWPKGHGRRDGYSLPCGIIALEDEVLAQPALGPGWRRMERSPGIELLPPKPLCSPLPLKYSAQGLRAGRGIAEPQPKGALQVQIHTQTCVHMHIRGVGTHVYMI